jgi:hypothetical protein
MRTAAPRSARSSALTTRGDVSIPVNAKGNALPLPDDEALVPKTLTPEVGVSAADFVLDPEVVVVLLCEVDVVDVGGLVVVGLVVVEVGGVVVVVEVGGVVVVVEVGVVVVVEVGVVVVVEVGGGVVVPGTG